MKQLGRTKSASTIIVLSLVLVFGSIAAAYAGTGDTSNCLSRWGEPIGISCATAAPATSLTEGSYTVNASDDAASTQCRTRWGEPIGASCVPSTVVALSDNASSTVKAADLNSTNCRAKWGEPIGIGCRVPAGK
ncbi:MAG: hypothetical protein AB1499_08910 [Nitrospirota bacterium]